MSNALTHALVVSTGGLVAILAWYWLWFAIYTGLEINKMRSRDWLPAHVLASITAIVTVCGAARIALGLRT